MDTDDSGNLDNNLYVDKFVYLFDFRLIYLFLKKIMS